MSTVFWLITIQAILGAIDNFWHHEITEKLPTKRSASAELGLHAAREFIYSIIFFGLAWWQWQGAYAFLIASVLLLEIVITITDFVVEDKTRRLPAFERALHTLLALNYGATLAVLLPLLWEQSHLSTAVETQSHGVFSVLFTLFGTGLIIWSLRNARAALRLSAPAAWVTRPIHTAAICSGRSVLITGATGFIGGYLVRRLLLRGDRILVLTRDHDKAFDRFGPHVTIVNDLARIADVEAIDAIVNLAGAPILALPWTRRRRAMLLASRVDTTRAIVALMARLITPIKVLVNASAVGYYGVHGDEDIDEHCGSAAGFQSTLCREWEAAALGGAGLATRIVRLRIGLVLGTDGGALPSISLPHRFGLGAVLGTGNQWVSWIHVEDLVGLVEFAIDKPAAGGILNGVAPAPTTHREFQRRIANTLQRPLWLRVPSGIMRLVLGEMSQLLVDGQRVFPNRPVALGYHYRYPHLDKALKHLLGRKSNPFESRCTDIYYNGDCPVCNLEMTHYARVSKAAAPELHFVDAMQNPTALAAYGLRREHLERRVYVKDSRGELVSGMPALILIWSQLPGYRALAWAFGLPGIRAATELIYDRLIAPGLAAWAIRRRDSTARTIAE